MTVSKLPLIAIGIWSAISAASAVTLTELKSQFRSGLIEQCFQTQRAAPLNAKLSDQLLTRYCEGVAKHAEDTVQVEDMLAATKGPIPRRMQIELNALGDACGGVAAGTIRDGPTFQK